MATAIRYPPTISGGDAIVLRLTRKERDLLAFLRQNAGKCLSRDLLLKHVWGYREGVRSRTLDVHVQRLRKKLGPVEGSRILTVFRAGYLWASGHDEPGIGSAKEEDLARNTLPRNPLGGSQN